MATGAPFRFSDIKCWRSFRDDTSDQLGFLTTPTDTYANGTFGGAVPVAQRSQQPFIVESAAATDPVEVTPGTLSLVTGSIDDPPVVGTTDHISVTPATAALVVGAELVTDGGFDTGYGFELVTNGTFDAGITSWANNSEFTGSIAWTSFQIGLITPIAFSDEGIASQSMTVVIGQTYRFTADRSGGNCLIYLGTALLDSTYHNAGNSTDPVDVLVVPTSTTLWVTLRNYDDTGSTALVDNISLREVLSTGSELVTNGTFDAGITSWPDTSIGTGSSQWNATGKLELVNPTGTTVNQGAVYQTMAVEVGKSYRLQITKTGGNSTVTVGSTSQGNDYLNGSQDLVAVNLVVVATTTLLSVKVRNYNDATNALIDDVSVTELTAEWEQLTPGTSMDGGECQIVTATGSDYIRQNGYASTQGDTLEVSLDVTARTSGATRFRFDGDSVIYTMPTSIGTHSMAVVNNGTTGFLYFYNSGATDITIDNVSVVSLPAVAATDHISVTPATGSLVTALFAPAVAATASVTVTPLRLALVTAALAASVATSDHIAVTPGSVALSTSGNVATVSVSNNIGLTPASVGLSTSGNVPSLVVSGNLSLAPGVVALSTSGKLPSIATTAHLSLTPPISQLTTGGYAPSVVAADVGAYEGMHNSIRSRFNAQMVATEVVSHVVYDNEKEIPPSDSAWVECSIQDTDTELVGFGGKLTYRKRGILRAIVHGPLGQGDGLSLRVCDAVRVAFNRVSDGAIRYGITSTGDYRRAEQSWEMVAETPFYSDDIVDREANVGGWSLLDREASFNSVRSRFNTLFGRSGSVSNNTVLYDNDPAKPPSDSQWIHFSINTGATEVIGAGADAWARTVGTATAMIFSPLGLGNKAPLELADTIVQKFRAITDTGVVYETPSLLTVGRRNQWWQTNCNIRYRLEEVAQ